MKKFLILTALTAILLTAACSSSPAPAPTTSTTPTTAPGFFGKAADAAKEARLKQCIEDGNDLVNDLGSLETSTSLVDPSSSPQVRRLISSSRSVIADSRQFLSECEQYAPAAAAGVATQIDALEDGADQLETYNNLR